MASKYEMISELYRRTGAGASGSPEAWQAFLSSACRNYKCRFDEQMLIYAQRSDATAVLEIEKWNEKFHRYVRRGSKGIAVFAAADNDKTRLKYYFDVSDTEPSYRGGMPVPIWQMSDRYEATVIERLSDRFGSAGRKALDDALTDTAKTAVEDNLPDYLGQLADVVEGSYLEAFDEENIEEKYRRLVTNSVNFMLFKRCGLPTDGTFEREDFADIVNFNTPETLTSVGIATSDIAESVLREISQTIREVQIAEKTEKNMSRTFAQPEKREYDRRERQTDIPERSNDHEQNHLHDAEGLPDSRPRITAAARSSAWQIRPPAEGVSGESQASDVRQSPDVRQADGASVSDRAGSNEPVRATDEAARTGAGRDGGTESQRSDDVDRAHEQHSPAGGGNDSQRADLQLNDIFSSDAAMADLPTIAEQIERIAEAEDAQFSAFVLSQEDIDNALIHGSGFEQGKFRVYRQYQEGKTGQEIIAFLKKEYGIGGHSYTFSDGSNGFISHDGKGDVLESVIFLTLWYGLRREEILGLRWSNVNFEKHEFHICETVVRGKVDGKWTRVERQTTKTDSSNRVLPMSETVETYLRQLIKRQQENRVLCGNCYTESDFVCVNRMGEPINPDYVTHHYGDLLKKSGLKKITFHELRHSCATYMIEAGYTPFYVKELLGHSSSAFTESVYIHAGMGHKQEMIETITSEIMPIDDNAQ